MTVLAVDPGTAKCGLAVVKQASGCLQRAIVKREDLLEQVRYFLGCFAVERVLIGGSTGSKWAVKELQDKLATPVEIVDEFRTTERARGRYFQDHPPRGLWRLIPLGLRVPAVAIDDYAAVVMAEDWLHRKETL